MLRGRVDDSSVSVAPTASSDALIAAARGGNSKAVGRLAERYRRYLLHVANESLNPALRAKVGASDVVQETMLHFQQKFERFEGQTEAELLAWLRRILYFRALEVARRFSSTEARNLRREVLIDELRDSRVGTAVVDPAPTPSTQLAHNEQAAALRISIAKLPPPVRWLIHLRNVERQSFSEIGKSLDCSEEAARKRWVRALAQLRRVLDKHE